MASIKNLKDEDRLGIYISAGIHLALILFFIFYTFSTQKNIRPSYMEVEVGTFKTGTQAQHAQKMHKKVAKSPAPSKTQPKHPHQNQPTPKKAQKTTTNKTSKKVNAPKQKQDVKSQKLNTPKTQKVNPRKKAAKKKKKKVKSKNKVSKNKKNKPVVPPKAQQANKRKKGAKKSGDKKGTKGKNADEGTGNQKQKSAPYDLNINGINRQPVVKPLPKNSSNYNATVKLKFEVTPDGKVVNIIPLHKSGNPAVDRNAIQTLRSWRFSKLPSDAPKQNQTGTITFHFVLH
ncbi:MAG TPA: TonB family protein [Balneolaceae bacterium]|nr:TonB family protein [Balneolaceae bacterium]